MKRRVVITGMGVVSPIGNTVAEVWDSVLHSRCGIGEITHFDATDFRAKLAGEVKNLDMEQYFTKRDLKFNDRFTQFTRIAAKQAYENSGLAEAEFNRDRFGVIMALELVVLRQSRVHPRRLKTVDQAVSLHISYRCL